VRPWASSNPKTIASAAQADVALFAMAWSYIVTQSRTHDTLEFAMEGTTPTTRFLPFLEAAEERALLSSAAPKVFERHQLMLDQDMPLRTIFLIDEGSARVERQEYGEMVPLAILGSGEFFGEMSFIDGAPTSARVVAAEPTRVRIIDEASVDRLTRIDPSFSGRLYRSIAAILVERLRRTSMSVSLENRQV
jgi:CRP-like cAMP-binding protein